ncbi:gonadotropin-releasing hormone II receptor-like [Corythoichthys intestinalis]|uniref:gonadotropin-releasing hormone II receptor-like n=1 Tax=Corythoichthys intestinalis TaxID=161448 RepID=UPI0025A4CCDB|nr:gonadotropin-releasing hormone II receptor-like [Corythoichthys intestinalis]XP_061789049.1 gonadotropin-releasing hormone II receptor-like [Nerophis lumbriciformis]
MSGKRSAWAANASLWEVPAFGGAARFRVGATAFLFVVAATGNLALMVSARRRPASRLRPLVTGLAAADLLMTFVVMPLDAVWNVTVQWYGGDVLCRLLSFLKLLAMQASASVPALIGLDRRRAVVRPLSARRGNRRPMALAWSISALLAAPQLFVFGAVNAGADFVQCATHGAFGARWQATLYNMFYFGTLYFVPLLVMSCCYGHIMLHIKNTHLKTKGQLRRSGTDGLSRARMKTLKMTVMIVLSFVACWTPYYLLGVWYWFRPEVVGFTPEYVHHGLFLFGNLNTCCDPLIYGFYTPSFRAELAACFRRRPAAPPGRDPDGRAPGPKADVPREETLVAVFPDGSKRPSA